jgi:exosortase A-associated hydrolase 2
MANQAGLASTVIPNFISAQSGDLFGLYYPAAAGSQIGKVILHIPAFAEEMNKSRRMVSMQAREFARHGYGVLILDLYGTGDSSGDFSGATWFKWQQDINDAISWLVEQGAESISLWGLRLGALLAMDFASKTDLKIDRLIGWQPVLNGETFVMQFLRLRVAASVMDRNAPQEKTSELKQQLADDKSIEVAGYLLNPDLINPILSLRAEELDLSSVNNVLMFEVVSSEDKAASPAFTKFIDTQHSRSQGAAITTVVGSPFWSTQEIVDVLALLQETVNGLN